MSVHDGHRQRVKQRFRKEGLRGFDDLHIVELLLFYCVPRRDTNLLAHKLIDHFGSLHRILTAPVSELEKIEGVNENIAGFLTLISAVNEECQIRKSLEVQKIRSLGEAGCIVRNMLANKRNEQVCMICLDGKNNVLSTEILGEGSVNSANVPIRRIVERAIAVNASSVIIGHNHPGGVPVASDEDISTTRFLGKLLQTVDVTLVDHIIVAEGEFSSLASTGLYRVGIDGGNI